MPHRVHNDLGPDTNDDDVNDHLAHHQNTRPLRRGNNVTKSDCCEYRDGEVERVSTRHRLVEIAS